MFALAISACAPSAADEPAAGKAEQEIVIPPDAGTPVNNSCSDSVSPFLCVPGIYPGVTDNFGEPSKWQTVTGDFDGDGKTDIARLGDTYAWVLYARGDGGYVPVKQPYPGLSFGLPTTWDAVTGDFNNDGLIDYARVGDGGAWMYFGNNNRTFTQKFVSFGGLVMTVPSPYTTIAGDFDGDRHTDIARLAGTSMFVFHYDGSSFFHVDELRNQDINTQLPDFGLPSPWTTIVGDFDGDGNTDFARLGDKTAWIFYGYPNRAGKFVAERQDYVSPIQSFGLPSPLQAIVGDFNNDHHDDYMRLDDGGAWVFESIPGQLGFRQGFIPYNGLSFGAPSTSTPIVGDFDGDGLVDYGRVLGTGVWMFYSKVDAQNHLIPNLNNNPFFGYNGQLNFGTPSNYTTVTGKFGHDKRASYARLGGTAEFTFIHD